MSKQLQIRNSTAEFLIFQAEDKAEGVQVFYKDESIWATQEAIAILFDKGRSTITEHLGNIYQSGELDVNTTCRKFRHMGSSGQEYETKYYNLDASKITSLSPTSTGSSCRHCLLTKENSESVLKVRFSEHGLVMVAF